VVRIAVALDRIGDVLVARNDLEGALKHYREGLDISRALYEQDKSHAERARDVFVSLGKIGLALELQGDGAAACTRYREARDINIALAKAAPDMHVLQTDGDWLTERMKEAGC
jgi:tetratricopeptide (TPR) repeat protein